MKEQHPIPFDTGLGDTKGNGCNDNDALILPRGNFREEEERLSPPLPFPLLHPTPTKGVTWNNKNLILLLLVNVSCEFVTQCNAT